MKKTILLIAAAFVFTGSFTICNSFAAGRMNYVCCSADAAQMKVGDYTMYAAVSGSISAPVYYANNACNSYYAVIDGEQYAVRENPRYTGARGPVTAYTHYVYYKGCQYYFSI